MTTADKYSAPSWLSSCDLWLDIAERTLPHNHSIIYTVIPKAKFFLLVIYIGLSNELGTCNEGVYFVVIKKSTDDLCPFLWLYSMAAYDDLRAFFLFLSVHTIWTAIVMETPGRWLWIKCHSISYWMGRFEQKLVAIFGANRGDIVWSVMKFLLKMEAIVCLWSLCYIMPTESAIFINLFSSRNSSV